MCRVSLCLSPVCAPFSVFQWQSASQYAVPPRHRGGPRGLVLTAIVRLLPFWDDGTTASTGAALVRHRPSAVHSITARSPLLRCDWDHRPGVPQDAASPSSSPQRARSPEAVRTSERRGSSASSTLSLNCGLGRSIQPRSSRLSIPVSPRPRPVSFLCGIALWDLSAKDRVGPSVCGPSVCTAVLWPIQMSPTSASNYRSAAKSRVRMAADRAHARKH